MDVLRNKQYRTDTYISRYTPLPYYYHSIDDRYILSKDAWLDDSTPYKGHTIIQGDTLDSLALQYYNNPTYFWIICSYNHISDPYIDLIPGEIIKIPSLGNIKFKK